MSTKQVDLDRISKQDAFSIAISLLYSLKENPQYSVLSELPYIVDYQSFIRIIQYYGGSTIRIPTIKEVSDTMKILLLYQNKEVRKMDWSSALVASGFSPEETNSARAKLSNISKIIESQNIGNRNYD